MVRRALGACRAKRRRVRRRTGADVEERMAKAADPAAVRERVRRFALGLPEAVEEFPWGESAIKVNKKVFVFLGVGDGSHPLGMTVKLTDPEAHAHALTSPGAEPAGYGLGRSGWVSIPLEARGAPAAELLCDWAEESYRAIAPKKLIAELDGS
jgi:predicted DNA-binding protein (MmcQ/YjbR family)